MSNKANGVKTIFMSIIGEDIYSYTDKTKREFKHMHNLNGCFIKEKSEEKIADVVYYPFSIIFVNKTRTYYLKEKSLAIEWIKTLRKLSKYRNFFDLYNILDDLGSTAYGKIMICENKETKEKAALKIIKSNLQPSELNLVRNEINILRMCKHPHIVQFLDYFENSEYMFIVTEYFRFGSLSTYIANQNYNIPEITASKITFQIACALKYLQKYGIFHRDLQPDNIMMFNTEGEIHIKINNFSLSKIICPEERIIERYGTILFTAPEILSSIPYNYCVDIWSLGVVIYYMMSGSYPFGDRNNNTLEIANMIINNELRFPEQIWDTKSRELKNLISQCLRKDQRERITIDMLVQHEWLRFYNNDEI